MRVNLIISNAVLIVAALASAAGADAKDDVVAAAKKLADSDNYSWTTTSEGAPGAGMSGGSSGKAQKDGLVELEMNTRDGDVRAFFQGDKGAFKPADGQWQSI